MDHILATDDDPLAREMKSLQLIVSEEVRDYALKLPRGAWSDFYSKEFTAREIEPLLRKLSSQPSKGPSIDDALCYRRILKKIGLICAKIGEFAVVG